MRPGTLERLTDGTVAMHRAGDLDGLCAVANETIAALVPCDWPVISLATTLLPNVRFSYSPHRADWTRFANDSLEHAHEDPVYTARLRLALDGPASVTGMIEPGEFERTAYHERVWKPMGISRLARYLTPGLLSFRVEVARERRREFSRDELAILHAIGRHLDAAAGALTRRHAGSIPVGGRLHPVQDFAWLVCDATGRVLRTTPEADARFRACLPEDAPVDRIPASWREELGSRARGAPPAVFWHTYEGRAMSVHIAPIRPTPDEYSVGFLRQPAQDDAEASLRAMGLSPRQGEVLGWAAQGKTNAEIAVILGISALTVKKHLESIFHILGVENRTAAVAALFEARRRHGGG